MGSKTTSSWRLGSSKKVVSESAALSLVVDVSLKGKTGKGFEALDLGVRLLGSGCWLRTENRVVRMDSEENEEREVAEKAIAVNRRKKKKISHQWTAKWGSYPNSQLPDGPWIHCSYNMGLMGWVLFEQFWTSTFSQQFGPVRSRSSFLIYPRVEPRCSNFAGLPLSYLSDYLSLRKRRRSP